VKTCWRSLPALSDIADRMKVCSFYLFAMKLEVVKYIFVTEIVWDGRGSSSETTQRYASKCGL